MALLSHAGTGSSDLGGRYLNRDDISETLLASLVTENNLLGLIPVGEDLVDLTGNWIEDRLNLNYVTDATGGGLNSSQTNWTVATAADAALLPIGTVVFDETKGDPLGEQMQVTGVSGTTITVVRGYGGTTAATHTNASVWRIVASPTYENSTLGADRSRLRLRKYNLVQRFELNVNLSQEVLVRAKAGAVPGVPSEIRYQFEQRLTELKRNMNNALIYSRLSGGAGGTTTGDYATMAGLISWLDGTVNSTSATYDALGGTLTDTIVNTVNKTITRNGAVADWLVGGTNAVEAFSRLYSDRIRIEQSDETRGFKVKYFDTSMQNTFRLLWDNAVFDNTTSANSALTTTKGLMFALDSSRLDIAPFKDSLFYMISAPSFNDGDAVRALSKWTLRIKNTGTDVGQAHQMIVNLGS